jgi:hypothetical protein
MRCLKELKEPGEGVRVAGEIKCTQSYLGGVRTHKLQDGIEFRKAILDWCSCEDKSLGCLTRTVGGSGISQS